MMPEDTSSTQPVPSGELVYQGAEARLYQCQLYSSADRPRQCIVKERFVKAYRHPTLDNSLSLQRLRAEVRLLLHCRRLGLHVPPVLQVDLPSRRIWLGRAEAVTLMQYFEQLATQLNSPLPQADPSCDSVVASTAVNRLVGLRLKGLVTALGRLLARLHANHVVHGDLTMANILVRQPQDAEETNPQLVLIDFGLGSLVSHTSSQRLPEEKAVDLYVFERALINAVNYGFLAQLSSTFPEVGTPESLMQCVLDVYLGEYPNEATSLRLDGEEGKCKKSGDDNGDSVAASSTASKASLLTEASTNLARLDEVRLRGRKRLMIG